MYTYIPSAQYATVLRDSYDLSMQKSMEDTNSNNYDSLNSSSINTKNDLKVATNGVPLKSDVNNYYTNYPENTMNIKSIHLLLDELFNVVANKHLPKFEDVQIAKERLKCQRMSSPLFSVLSDLKEKNITLNSLIPRNFEENIHNLQTLKYAKVSKIGDSQHCRNQIIRLDNMLEAEGIINKSENISYKDTSLGNITENSDDYQSKLNQIREIYCQEEVKINQELNIFPLHVSNILQQQSELRPITQSEIEFMQKIVFRKNSMLHIQLKQKTCEATMILRTKCLDARRRRRNFSKKASDILNEFFFANVRHPYPSEEDKQELAKKCGITVSQVCNWFGNKRIRYKKSEIR